MPARMWKHGIQSFLELLRQSLPASMDHMLAFIFLAYYMMVLLYETVPAFEDTWIEHLASTYLDAYMMALLYETVPALEDAWNECLGDLARYRMAIEDDDIRGRETWTGVSENLPETEWPLKTMTFAVGETRPVPLDAGIIWRRPPLIVNRMAVSSSCYTGSAECYTAALLLHQVERMLYRSSCTTPSRRQNPLQQLYYYNISA